MRESPIRDLVGIIWKMYGKHKEKQGKRKDNVRESHPKVIEHHPKGIQKFCGKAEKSI